MRLGRSSWILVALGVICFPSAASAEFALTWTGSLVDSTRVTVAGFYTGGWPGVPSPPRRDGDQSEPAAAPADSHVLHAIFGDAPDLRDCAVTVDQGPVHRDGDDGYFYARPGEFAGAGEVTVFFAWSGSLESEACEPTTGVRFALPLDTGPGEPGKPTR